MKLAIHHSSFTHPDGNGAIAPALSETVRIADQGGVDQFTFMDHYFQIENVGRPEEPMLEGYTALGFVAGQTRNLKLGLLVTGVTYRYPGLLAKIVSTLDILSNGRALLGIGAAWYEREHLALGVPYPSLAERFERLEEALQICRQMWSDDDGPFHGKHYQLAETMNHPQPIQRPHPPILIGGGGEQKTLRLVARYGDACNLFAWQGQEPVAHKLDVLRRHCETEGTDYDRIEKTITGGPNAVSDTDAFLSDMEGYARLGVTRVEQVPPGDDSVAWTTQVCERVVPRLAEIG